MKLILVGIQGSGKSTQGNILSERLGIPYLSSGHIFRQMAAEKTSWGDTSKTLNAGYLIPDEKAISIIERVSGKTGVQKRIYPGRVPRTSKQAEVYNGVERVIYLKVTGKEELWRLDGRFEDGIREDNTLQAIRKRIQLFHDITEPVLEYYRKQNRLLEVDGEKTIEDVTAHILTGLGVS